jgi:septum formation protein
MRIILGSQSVTRKRVLERWGFEFGIVTADMDEKSIRDDNPVKLTLKLAHAKADAILPKITEPAVLITCDLVAVYNGKVREKPIDYDEAYSYLENAHIYPSETVTGMVVANTETGERVEGTNIARIWFERFPKKVIEEYIATGDCYLHAGGFDFEHPLLAPYTAKIEGEPESILGLPRKLTLELLSKFGVKSP